MCDAWWLLTDNERLTIMACVWLVGFFPAMWLNIRFRSAPYDPYQGYDGVGEDASPIMVAAAWPLLLVLSPLILIVRLENWASRKWSGAKITQGSEAKDG